MSDEERPLAPPGWYPAADGSQRYWDGSRWSETPAPPTPPEATGGSEKKPDKVAAGCGIGCLAIVGVVVAVFIYGMFTGDDEGDDGGGEYGARDVCEQFIEKRLRSPGSAEFSQTEATDNGTSWIVSGAVDSQNGFGALVRNRYDCEVRHVSGEDWRLVDLEMTGN